MKKTTALIAAIAILGLPGFDDGPSIRLDVQGNAVQGDPLLLALSTDKPAEYAEGEFLGQKLRFDPLGERLIVLAAVGRNTKPGAYDCAVVVLFEDGMTARFNKQIIIGGHDFPAQSLSVDPSFVHLSTEDLERVRRDNAAAAKAYASSGPKRLWNEPFVIPAEAEWSAPFGVRRMFNGEERSYHSGADIAVVTGTPVHSANRGRVALVMDMFFGGNTILVDHGQSVFTGYMHLSEFKVKEGEMVERGQLIGLSGATGRVTGPHLHWMLRINDIKCNAAGLLEMKLN